MRDVFVKFRYEERDIANALRLRMMAVLRRRLEITLVVVVAIIGCMVSFRLAPWLLLIVAGFVTTLVLGVLVVMPKVILRRSVRLRGPMSVDASDEGITITAAERFGTIRWSDCVRVEVDKRVCALYHGSEVLLVPRRAFRSAKREKAFLDLVARFVQKGEHESREP